MQRRSYLSLLSCLVVGGVAPTVQESHAHPNPSAAYSVRLVDEAGRDLPVFWKRGQRWVLGEYGRGYGIAITNHTGRRVEAVVSVDGRDAVNGSTGNYVTNRGYVLSPYGSVTVSGFRQSLTAVAAFRFSSPDRSYSARMGSPQNVGVIGVAFFPEYVPPPPLVRRPLRRQPKVRHQEHDGTTAEPHSEQRRKRSTRAEATSKPREAPSSAGAAHDHYESTGNLGTEYGQTEYNPVEETAFRRAHAGRPALVQTLRYDDAKGLRARGIEPYPRPRPRPPEPEAFPENRFAPPPH